MYGIHAASLQINFSRDSKIFWDHQSLCTSNLHINATSDTCHCSTQIPATLHCAGYTQESIIHLYYSISAL